MDTKEKEVVEQITKGIASIQEEVKALKTKGEKDADEQADKLKELKEQINNVATAHGHASDEVKALKKMADDTEKAFTDLALSVKSMNVVKHGRVDEDFLVKLLSEQKEKGVLDSLKKSSGGLVERFTIKSEEFWRVLKRMSIKAAGNITEGGNLLGTDPIPPMRLPGIHFDPTRPKHIREVINSVNTDSPVISYGQETGFNDGSGVTAQGSAAGQSDFTITQKEITTQYLNAYFNIHKSMMEDTNWVNNYLTTRGFGKLLMKEDTALFLGNGSPSISGLQPSAVAYDNRSLKIGKVAGDLASQSINFYDVLSGAGSMLRDGTNGYYDPTAALMHTDDFTTLSLARSTYGNLQFPIGMVLKPGGADIIENTVCPIGYFLVGDFSKGATLAYRDEMELTFSNQNSDNFVKGFITCLIEERIGLVVHNPNAFVYGNFAAGEASGSI